MSIYKDCDIRGVFEKEFDVTEGYHIGKAVGTIHKGAMIVVAGDVRISTPALKKELIRGMVETGVHVIDLGTTTTPMFYYAINKLAANGGVMVTASHNPPQYNGFKLMFGDEPITVQEIQDIKTLVNSKEFAEGKGKCEHLSIANDYQEFMKNYFGQTREKPLKIVLDCGNGATSEFVPKIVGGLGYEVVPLYCDVDGNFPNRDPDPALYTCLGDLSQKVVDTQADLGAAYDGDGDRVVFVDNKGRVINSEKSYVIFIGDLLKQHQKGRKYKGLYGDDLKPSFVYDQKSMMIVKQAADDNGGEAIIEKSGYGFIKRSFLKSHAMMGGEISGHFFFGELGGDDGLFATLMLCQILEKGEESLAQLVDEIPPSYISPELRIACPYEEQDELLAKAREFAKGYQIDELDGVRITFPHGWFLIRKSITSQAVTVRMEGDSPESLKEIKQLVKQALPTLATHDYFKD